VDEASERPTKEEYDRYLWLVELLRKASYEEAVIQRSHPFLVKDVLFSAILVAANEALLSLAGLVEAPDEDRARIEDWISRGRRGLEDCWEPELDLCLDHDLRVDKPLHARTIAGFAPLVAAHAGSERLDALQENLFSPAFAGNGALRWPLPPSTSPDEARFNPRAY